MSDQETRCTFETMGAALRCRYSDGHAGPHVFLWIPGTERTAEVERLQLELQRWHGEADLAQAEVERLRAYVKYAEQFGEELGKARAEVERLRAAAIYWQKLCADNGIEGDIAWAVWNDTPATVVEITDSTAQLDAQDHAGRR
jgi:hypothetical protein